jgi:hypothetical protein
MNSSELRCLRCGAGPEWIEESKTMEFLGIRFNVVEDPTVPPDEIRMRGANGQEVRVIGLASSAGEKP